MLLHYKKSSNIQIDLFGENHVNIANSYEGISACYFYKGNYSQGLNYSKKILKIRIDALGNNHPNVAASYNNIGMFYGKKGDHNNEMIYLNKALNIQKSVLGDNNIEVARSYGNIALCYSLKKNYEKALGYYEKAFGIKDNILESDDPVKARTYTNMGMCYRETKQYDQALKYYQQSLIVLCQDFENRSVLSNPDLININSKLELLNALSGKAYTLYLVYDDSLNINDLKFSLSTYGLSVALIDSLRFEITSTDSQQKLISNSISVYESGINSALQLYQKTQEKQYLYKAFNIAEKSKAFQLLQAQKISDAMQFAAIPDTLLLFEREVRSDIAGYEGLLNREQWKKDDLQNKEKIVLWQNKIFDLKQQQDSLINTFETQYPAYYKLKYDFNVATVQQVQNEITNGPDKALLEYFVADNSIYVFCITQNDVVLHRIQRDSIYEDAFDQFLSFVSQPLLSNDEKVSLNAYTRSAYELYKLLVEKPIKGLDDEIDHLIIIPDGELGYFPFNALITQLPENWNSENYNLTDLKFLIENYVVRYGYSSTLSLEQKKTRAKKKSKNFLTAFAPSFRKSFLAEEKDSLSTDVKETIVENITRGCNEEFGELPYAKKEVKEIINIIKTGENYIDEKATKANFLKASADSRILHLATHACVEDRDPLYSKLFFTDDYISTYELYNMELNTDLAVLSACNTGVGEVRRGEEIMSLSRGFAHAGCPSMVMSLWSVDDMATSELMADFYRNLGKGLAKDISLQKAQLTYLKNESLHPNRLHPYYWAAFVQIGNSSPIEMTKNKYRYFALVGISVLLTIFLMFRRKNKEDLS